MSKLLPATCVGGVVTSGGVPLTGTTILSEGQGQSEGVVILDEETNTYLAKTTPDLISTLTNLIDVLGQIKEGLQKAADALTALDTAQYIVAVSGGSGAPAVGTPSPPVATGDISGVTQAASQIDPIISELETLKGSLK